MQKQSKLALKADTDFGIKEYKEPILNHTDQKIFVVENTATFIWKKLKEGDETALGELYNLYIDSLFTYGINCTKDRAYVMDCIHDLFVDLYKYRESLAMTNNVKYYLFTSLKRKINRKYRSKTVLISAEYQYSLQQQHNNYTSSCEDEIIKRELLSEKRMLLTDAMEKLTKKQQKGLFLRFNQQRSYEEISEIMGVSVATARTTIYRAIKALR